MISSRILQGEFLSCEFLTKQGESNYSLFSSRSLTNQLCLFFVLILFHLKYLSRVEGETKTKI